MRKNFKERLAACVMLYRHSAICIPFALHFIRDGSRCPSEFEIVICRMLSIHESVATSHGIKPVVRVAHDIDLRLPLLSLVHTVLDRASTILFKFDACKHINKQFRPIWCVQRRRERCAKSAKQVDEWAEGLFDITYEKKQLFTSASSKSSRRHAHAPDRQREGEGERDSLKTALEQKLLFYVWKRWKCNASPYTTHVTW